jgi:hypothetical protein
MGTSNGSPNEQSISNGIGSSGSGDESDNEFLYPGATEESEQSPQYQMPDVVSQPHPSPAQLEALYAAASAGDLVLLQRTLRSALASSDVGAFALANDASPRTGLTALHAAASRGYVDIVKWRKHIGLSGIQWLMMPSLYSDRGMRCHARLGRQGRRGKHMFILLLECASLTKPLADCTTQNLSSRAPPGCQVPAPGQSRCSCARCRWLDSIT